jgi:hypothetical protein
MFTAGDSHKQGVPDPFGWDFEQALNGKPEKSNDKRVELAGFCR